MFRKKETPTIQFVSTIPGLSAQKDILPYSAKKYSPHWWKEMPFSDNNIPTIKRCPAIPDLFSTGYIVPMWMDLEISNIKPDGLNADFKMNKYGTNFENWSAHYPEQFTDSMDFEVANRKTEFLLKATAPWYVVTPKGWSIFVMPLSYEFTSDYTIVPGLVDTDVLHQMNHPMIIHSNGKGVSFKRTDPFICYIPFERTEYNMEIISDDKKMSDYVLGQQRKWSKYREESKNQLGSYRKMQKERDRE